MKRAAVERPRTVRVWRQHFLQHVANDVASGGQRGITCACEFEVGRFRKGQKVGGCGQPRCYLCHGEKLLGLPTRRDLRNAARIEDEYLEAE